MEKRIILISDIFPYQPGEEFLETEIKYWSQQDGVDFIIMPKTKTNYLRTIPENISIDYTLVNSPLENINQKKMGIKALISSMFYRELYTNAIINPKKLKHTLIACRVFFHYRGLFKRYLEKQKDKEIVFYSYWHTEVCYALQDLKSEFDNIKVVSRIHGFDLYEERRAYSYMPLKRQFTKSLDRLFQISEKGKEYAIQKYGFKPHILEVARLGIEDRQITTLPSENNNLNLVSCSYVIKVKRIDKIIRALQKVALSNPMVDYKWTHIGDGPLLNEIKKNAEKMLNNIMNVQFCFKGHMDNQKIYKFYKDNKIDVFVNSSESEGVPVTIMEAMSCHIPIIAPNIGGISEMINNKKSGCLLSSSCNINELVATLNNSSFFKNTTIRNNAYRIYKEQFSGRNNYELFINNIIELLSK